MDHHAYKMLRMSILAMAKKEMEGDLNLIVCNGMPLYPQLSIFYRYLVSMPHGRLSAPKLSEIAQYRCKILIINGLDEVVKNLARRP
jgi:hypothetical protein